MAEMALHWESGGIMPRFWSRSRAGVGPRFVCVAVVVLGTLLSCGDACRAQADPKPADGPITMILHHGKIVTVSADFRLAEAIAFRGERIAAVGSNDDVRKLAGPRTEQIDLGGKTVIPGLCDSHVHPVGAALYEFDHPVPDMETIADVLKYVEQRAKVVPEGEWIQLSQVFITRLRDQRYPNRHELDKVAPKHPVLFSTGPDASLNSLALQLSGIDKDYKITDGGTGQIEKDPVTGEPTGILRSCTRLVKAKSSNKSAGEAERRERLKALFRAYNEVGITSISDRNASDDALKLYEHLREKRELTVRVFAYYAVDGQATAEKISERIRKAAEHPLHKYDNFVWLRGIKVFLDGGMLTGSAYMRQPWGVSSIYSITDPKYQGLRFIPADRLKHIVDVAMRNNLQPTAHAVGDGATLALIDAYEELKETYDLRAQRPCVTHCNFLSVEAIDKMQKLGIVADLQPAWLYLDGATLTKQFGDERLTYFQPYKTLFERQVIIGGGSDHMQKIGSMRSVNPYHPFWGMWVTLTRQPRWSETPLHAEQVISREQALRLYTINNAFLSFEEKEKGSLEVGKLADAVVLEHDILTCPVEQIRTMPVLRTIVGGKVVYQK